MPAELTSTVFFGDIFWKSKKMEAPLGGWLNELWFRVARWAAIESNERGSLCVDQTPWGDTVAKWDLQQIPFCVSNKYGV